MLKKLLLLTVLISFNIITIAPPGLVFADSQTSQIRQINSEMASVNNKIEQIEDEIKKLSSQIAEKRHACLTPLAGSTTKFPTGCRNLSP